MVVKAGKANANADYLSRQRGTEAVEDIQAKFPDEFSDEPDWKDAQVLHISGEEESEFSEIISYLVDRTYPSGLSREEKSMFQSKVSPYTIIQGILFRIRANEQLKRCLEKKERKQVMRALHSGPSGGHFATTTIANRIWSVGYWWPYLVWDVKAYVGSCDQCQRMGAPAFRNHWPLTPNIPIYPFEKWGIDFVGRINPVSARRNRYIILATDYATKWVEARPTRKNDAAMAATFLFEAIMMRFRHPLEIVSDRGTHFLNDVICNITTKYLINHRKTTPYNPKANGLTKRANGIIGKVLNKLVAAHKTDWDLKLPSVVHAYNTSEKSTTGRNPYFLVFGQIAVHGIELEIETHRIIAARTGNRIEDLNARLIAIKDLEEAQNKALDRMAEVQTKRKEEFDSKLPDNHGITPERLVLLYDNRHKKFPGKLHTRWMQPYRVTEVYPNGPLQLEDLQGVWLDTRINGSRIKAYKPKSSTEESGQEWYVRRDSHI